MINELIKQVEGVFGLATPTRRRKRTVRIKRRVTRSYSAPARRTKRTAKRTTSRRRR